MKERTRECRKEEGMITHQADKSLLATSSDHSSNEHEITELYVLYKRKVYRIALSYVKDTFLAEDLAHEILVKCYLTREKFKGECSLNSWIYRIARNHCIDFLRKSYRHRDQLHENVELFNDIYMSTPESEIVISCENEELRNKLRQLPSKYGEVIYLYYFKEKSLREIEGQLKIKLSTVKTRLFRGKRMLKEMY
jgi:RNA polymerase sigma-70 factor (ECF subfamily)